MLTEEYQAELGKYAKNYLPILFNVYTSEESETSDEHQVVIDTVRDYLKVTDQQVRNLCTYCVPISRYVLCVLTVCQSAGTCYVYLPCDNQQDCTLCNMCADQLVRTLCTVCTPYVLSVYDVNEHNMMN